MAMFSSAFEENNEYSNSSSVTLKDEAGRSLECYVERSLLVEDKEYLLLLPADAAVEIFAWQSHDSDEEEAVPVEDDETINSIFPTAEAVLAEQNLVLKRTAYALTVAGELPPVEESELFTLEIEDDTSDIEPEQLQLLASFYHEDQEYSVYTPLDPLLFFARLNSSGNPELLSPEEFQKLQPLLAEQLIDEMEE
ncbi:MAG: hypothetical protein CLLPBCKN_003618 [Chroococcidiopsis cubana SAG 39.79]|jgi:hypothetical protein|uniref:DUF3727 domain-containing protein n=3 Tax=Cyanophyceae TaxID=3028117 RepID=K9TXL9_CHRTP|nr:MULTISPECIES: DUF3727 domain-containing protein [Chroococcidiopsis]AFY86926.1 protein of unknown function DUF1292 [Chroococcidiopsis thermalis PCC 7203]MDV2991290.1 hypothetical protein [Chroococcidiopsis sp. SAG 2025]MDZ4874222.1 hypothetical protein [Chroococcidiopsis cubana SAG 39.79]RUT13821.1 hypothetical protein DSM107010_07210 [Chroococcidiopsis cubana SAG 39.79]URD51788.1 DUF3727 domain-containing protein [Chroococcidiopsis sp. CCNUC1]